MTKESIPTEEIESSKALKWLPLLVYSLSFLILFLLDILNGSEPGGPFLFLYRFLLVFLNSIVIVGIIHFILILLELLNCSAKIREGLIDFLFDIAKSVLDKLNYLVEEKGKGIVPILKGLIGISAAFAISVVIAVSLSVNLKITQESKAEDLTRQLESVNNSIKESNSALNNIYKYFSEPFDRSFHDFSQVFSDSIYPVLKVGNKSLQAFDSTNAKQLYDINHTLSKLDSNIFIADTTRINKLEKMLINLSQIQNTLAQLDSIEFIDKRNTEMRRLELIYALKKEKRHLLQDIWHAIVGKNTKEEIDKLNDL